MALKEYAIATIRNVGLYLTLLLSHQLYAEYIPSDEDVSVFSPDNGALDVITLSPPNTNGISVNNFTSFSSNNQPLQILNTTNTMRFGGNEVEVSPAKLIVIQSNNINISNSVEIIGATADVLFVATGNITCTSCEFENVSRLGMVTTPTMFADDVEVIGELTPSPVSSISIAHLDAPGVMSLGILTGNMSLSGNLNTHQRAIADSDGGYAVDNNGNLLVGSAAIDIMLGDITWDYDSSMIKEVGTGFSGIHSLAGHITSTAIKVSSADDVAINFSANTETNLLTSTSYNGGVYIPQEGIEVQTFANKNLTHQDGQIKSASVKLKSTGSLLLSSSATIDAKDLELIAKTTINNNADVQASMINIAGDSVVNQAELVAEADVNIWAHKHLANQYGGEIKAHTINLESATQVVRNGSRTPYISTTTEISNFLNSFAHTSSQSINMGTFYRLYGGLNLSDPTWLKPDSHKASLVANRINIKAVAFENINPYYEKVRTDGTVQLEVEHINQVAIYAESYLGIDASRYIINSSAGMIINDVDGQLEASTAMFANERYRISTALDKADASYSQFLSKGFVSKLFNIEEEAFGSRVLAYSTPGIVRVLGDFDVKASQAFLNDIAYLEIFGDAAFDTPLVNDNGLSNESISQLTVYDPDPYAGSGFFRAIKRTLYNLNPTSHSETSAVLAGNDLDSLFFVQGNLSASAALGWFRNYKPLDYFVNQAIHYGIPKPDPTQVYFDIDPSAPQVSTIDQAKQTGDVVVNGVTYDLFDRLDQVLGDFVDTITAFFAELDWWN